MSQPPKPNATPDDAPPSVVEAEHLSPAGASFELTDAPQRREAVEKAFDYRGDVTVVTTHGRTIEGYVYDRHVGEDQSYLRMMAKDGGREKLAYNNLAALHFADRDPAAGKSWETWMKKYVEKKMKGEEASIHAEPLD